VIHPSLVRVDEREVFVAHRSRQPGRIKGIFGPLLFTVARAAGINEVHYAIVAVLAMGIGLFAPPLGVGFFSYSATLARC
jgi:hypothetical protein